MATDSVIQFNYSDSEHMISLYIKSDTHHEIFIPELENIITTIDQNERFQSGQLNWDFFIVEIIYYLRKYFGRSDSLRIIQETPNKNCNVIYKHVITPNPELYKNHSELTSKSLNIKSIYPISNDKLFNGSLFDFVKKIKLELENNDNTKK